MSIWLKRAVKAGSWSLIAVLYLSGANNALAAPDMQKMQQMMQQQIQMMKPELQRKVKDLTPETKQLLLRIYSQHSRHSSQITLRHVMHEVLADYQSMIAGIVTDNPEQAADSARRLADHRIPRGGLLPYLKLEDVSNEKLSLLASFNDSVEGNAKRLADAAESGDMAKASSYLTDITTGCIGCHQAFRGVPGISTMLR